MDREDLIAYVRTRRDGVVSTLGADGSPQAAYLELTATAQGEIVFDARPDSRKVANLMRDPRIAVVVGGRDGTTLQCEGTADLPVGAERERCVGDYLRDFPQYEESLASGAAVLVRVAVTWARFGDFTTKPPSIAEVGLLR